MILNGSLAAAMRMMRLAASNIVKSMADMGVTDLGVINIAKGDTSSDLRDKGAAEGCRRSWQ